MEVERDRSPINNTPRTPSDSELYPIDDDNLPEELKAMFLKNRCNLCKVSLTSAQAAQQHYIGKTHVRSVGVWVFSLKRNIGNTDTHLFCKICNLVFSSSSTADSHYIGRKHKKAVSNLADGNKMVVDADEERRFGIGESFKPPQPVIIPETANLSCDVCVIFCPNEVSYQAHLAGSKHKRKLAIANGENGNGTSPVPDESQTGPRLLKRIAKVDLNCCGATFQDIVELVDHLKSLNHVSSIRNVSHSTNN